MTPRKAVRAQSQQGFTLIEVMIAVAIISLSLSVVFGNSIFASQAAIGARRITTATQLARCRMTEVEGYIASKGFSEDDQTIEDPPDMGGEACCKGTGFECSVKVIAVKLPDPPAAGDVGSSLLNRAASAVSGSNAFGAGGSGGGAVDQLATAMGGLSQGGPGGSLSRSGAPNLSGVMKELLVGLYPTIKPLYEQAIRKVVLRVSWHEGSREKHFDVIQYIVQGGRSFAPKF